MNPAEHAKTVGEFQFVTAAYLTRITNLSANNLNELHACLDQASDASIFCHTFQSLSPHHFLTEGVEGTAYQIRSDTC